MTATVGVYGFTKDGLEHKGTAPAPVLLKPLPLISIDTEVEDSPNKFDPLGRLVSARTTRPARMEDLPEIFEAQPGILDGCEVLICIVNEGQYDGDAYVLYQKGRDLFEVEASHCSCYGFEGQWQPTRVPRKYLQLKVNHYGSERGWRRSKFNIEDPIDPLEKQLAALLWYWEKLDTDERPE